MHRNFSLKFRISDIFVIIFSLVLASCFMVSIVLMNQNKKSNHIAVVYCASEKLDQYTTDLNSLTETLTIVLKKEDYHNLLGDFTIEMDKNKGVRVTEVTCPNHTCSKQGWVNISNLPIICIPNDVMVEIVAHDGSDIIV